MSSLVISNLQALIKGPHKRIISSFICITHTWLNKDLKQPLQVYQLQSDFSCLIFAHIACHMGSYKLSTCQDMNDQ